MRCLACNEPLTDFESSARSARTREYLDMCSRCLSPIRQVLETSENFLLYDPELDDLSTNFYGTDDVAFPGGTEDDSTTGVTTDGERVADGGRHES